MIVAGSSIDGLANAAVTIRVLRRHMRCHLPIEVVHFGSLGEPRKEHLVRMLEAEGTERSPIFITNALSDEFVAPSDGSGEHRRRVDLSAVTYASKAFSLAFVTRFREVLLLDADNLPLMDPEELFETREFREHGNLFWPDFWRNAWVNPAIYQRLGMSRDEPPWEGKPEYRLTDSGQLLIDRLEHADVLEWLWLLNSHTEVVYKSMHGDKDTYKLAFFLAGKLKYYQQVSHFARDAARDVASGPYRYHHLGMLQSTPDGLPSFFHRTSFNSKFFPDCAKRLRDAQENGGGDGAKTPDLHYCEPQWVTVPLTDLQASNALKKDMFAWEARQLDTQLFGKACGDSDRPGGTVTGGEGSSSSDKEESNASTGMNDGRGRSTNGNGSEGTGNRSAPSAKSHPSSRGHRDGGSKKGIVRNKRQAPEAGCDSSLLGIGKDRVPVPALPVQRMGSEVMGVLEASYLEFYGVLKEAKV